MKTHTSIEPLEARISPALITATWLGGDGNWNDPSKWSTGVVPNNAGGNDYHVVLDVAGTVTITAAGSIAIHSLSNAENLDITGSYFSPTFFRLTGGGTLTNTGTIELVSDEAAADRCQLFFDETTLVDGAGDILLTGLPMLNGAAGADVTIAAGQKVHGFGYVNVPSLDNAGIFDADVAGKFLSVTTTGVNTGTLLASAGLLRLTSTNFDNTAGLLKADGGTVEVTNSSLPGGQWIATDNAASRIKLAGNVDADGASWQAVGAGEFQVAYTTATLSGDVAFTGGKFSLTGQYYAPMRLNLSGGTFTNNGTIELVSDNADPNRALLWIGGDATFDGNGDVNMTGTPMLATDPAATLTLDVGQTLHGHGIVMGSYVNNGTIEADSAAGPLMLNGPAINNADGTIGARGGRLAVNEGTTISGGVLTVNDDAASVIDFSGTIGVDGTTWSGAGAGRFRVNYGTTATLDGSVHLTQGQFDVLGHYYAGVRLSLGAGTWTNDGLIHLLSDNNDPNRAQIYLDNNVTLNGDGVLWLEHMPMITGAPGRQLTVGADQLIHGSGVINVPVLANAGTITADAAGETLTISSAGTNTKLMNATAGTLRFDTANLTNIGATIRADGATVSLTNSTIIGGDIVATDNPASRVSFDGPVNVNATTWTANGAGEFQVAYTTATLNGNVNFASGRFVVIGNYYAPVHLYLGGGAFVNDGRIELVSDNNDPNRARIYLNADTFFTGTGEIELIGTPMISGAADTKLTLDAGQTLHGHGTVNVPLLDNAGVIASDVADRTLVVTSAGTNTGVMHASAGTLQLNGSNFTNTGATLRADGGIVELVNSTITGGSLVATDDAASRVRFAGNVNADGTTWIAAGAGEFQVNYTTATLSGAMHLASGKFALLGQYFAPMRLNLVSGAVFTNNGTIELISDNAAADRGLIYVEGNATLAGGGDLKMINNPKIETAPGATLTIGSGQKVHGFGYIVGSFTNEGTIEADAGASVLNLNAVTITNTTGTLRANAGRLAVNDGTTITGGTLAVTDDAASLVDFAGTIGVDGTTWSGAGAGRFRVPYTTATLNGNVHVAGGEFDVLGSRGAPVYLNLGGGTWTNDGLIHLLSDNNDPNRAQIHLNDNVTLDGSGVLWLEHTPMISGAPGIQLTVSANQVIHGSGVINVPLLANAGTITADEANRTLTISSTGTNTNLMNATAGTLSFSNANVTNTGATIRAEGGGVTLVNTTITGGALAVTDDAASVIDFAGTIGVDGTTWSGAGAGRFRVPYTTATLNGSVHLATGEFDVLGNYGTPVYLNLGGGTFVNDGIIKLVSDNSDPNRAQIHLNANVALDGSGELRLVNTPLVSGDASTELTIGAGQTVHGFGYIAVPTVRNDGRICVDEAGDTLVVQSNVINSGKLAAIGGIYGRALVMNGHVTLTGDGTLGGDATGLITFAHDITGDTTGGVRVNGPPNVRFDGPSNAGAPQWIEVMDRDLGWTNAGFAGAYSYRALELNGAYLKLQDVADNAPGTEAIYIDTLNVYPGNTLDLNGQRIYVRTGNLSGTIIGDAGAPTSSVTALPAYWLGSDLNVQWSGEDDAGGTGLAAFDIYVSDNGGPFTLWLDDTTATSAQFAAQDGHTYAFYSVARDNIGFVEAAPAIADASVEVRFLAITSAPVTSVNEDAQYLYDAASNADGVGPVLAWSFVTAPSQLGMQVDTGAMNGVFDNAAVGDHTVTLRVTDDQGHHADQTFTITVANVAGEFADQTVPATMLGQPFAFDLDSTDEGSGGTAYSLIAGPAWLSVNAATGALSGTPARPADLASVPVTVRVDDQHGGIDEQTFMLDVQGQLITLDPVLRQTKATFTDANGDLVTVSMTGKDGRVHLLRSIAPDANGDYSNLTPADLFAIQLDGTTLKDGLTVTVKYDKRLQAGDKLTTLGELGGTGSLTKLSAPALDLIGTGVNLPADTIAALTLHDVNNGADITLGGAQALKGASFTAHDLDDGSALALGSALKLLKANEWSGGTLTAPSAGSFRIAGDLDADLTFAGPLKLLKVGNFSGGSIHATTLSSLTIGDDASFDLTLTDALAKTTLGTTRIGGDLLGSVWDVAGKIASITVARTIGDTVIRSGGDIGTLSMGASDGSVFGAGVDLAMLIANGHADTAPTGTIKTFNVKGWKIPKLDPIPRFTIDTQVSAKIGTMSLHNWDGTGGLWAPTGAIKKITHHDTAMKDAEHNWVFPEPARQVSGQPELFVHLL